MIDLYSHPIFAKHVTSLESTSRDTANNKCMSLSNIMVINFDKFMKDYSLSRSIIRELSSNDALFCDDDCLVFVEFKNGRINNKDAFDIRKKVYDSVLAFLDTTSMTLAEMRANTKYILVYNGRKDQYGVSKQDSINGDCIQESPDFGDLTGNMNSISKTECILFGLDLFLNYCFKEVHTYTQDEFEHYIAKHCCNCPKVGNYSKHKS